MAALTTTFPSISAGLRTIFQLHFKQEFIGHANVGDTIPVYLSVGASAQDYVTSGDGHFYQTHIDASHTIKLFVDPTTPGVVLTSDSGHNYAIPEPASLGMLTLGLALVAMGWLWWPLKFLERSRSS